jgi:hypothetical protein
LSAGTDLRQLLRELPGTTLAIEMFCQDPLYSHLLRQSPGPATEIVEHVTTMNVELSGEFDEYWATRSKNLRKNIARYFRRVESAGISWRLEVVCGDTQLQQALIRYSDIESAGWKGSKGTAIGRDNAQGRFYADVLKRFSDAGRARIYELYFDDRVVASRICVLSDALLVILKTTYDQDTSQYASGKLLLHALLEREFAEQRFKAIEFYTSATRDQISWATGTRPIFHLTQFRNSLIKSLIRASRPVRTWVELRKYGSSSDK